MNIFIDDNEVEEKLISDVVKSFDTAIITIKGENVGKRDEGKDDLTKEIIANDAIVLGSQVASRIHGVPQSSASKYKDGLDIADDDTRTRVLATRHNIADTAVAKLMETLNMFRPDAIDKQVDVIKSASMLAGIVEKISVKDGKNGGNEVHLHLYGPKQNKIDRYETIDV